MKYIVLIATALFGAAIHAPSLKKTKKVSHLLHDAGGVSNPLLNQTRGDGLIHELKIYKESIEKRNV